MSEEDTINLPRSTSALHTLTPFRKKKARGSKFKPAEVDLLLDLIDEVEPLGQDHWNILWTQYEVRRKIHGYPERDTDSLRQKFKQLRNVHKPTGDPSCPEAVRRAKRIFAKVRAYISKSIFVVFLS